MQHHATKPVQQKNSDTFVQKHNKRKKQHPRFMQ